MGNSLLSVPQSPSQIRKMFQKPEVFQRSWSRTAEVEFPAEMQAGLRGKVKQSRETFLTQTQTAEPKIEVPPSPRQSRRRFDSSSSATETLQRNEEMRAAKMEELEAVRATRAQQEHEAFLIQEVTSAGAREREERAAELAMMSARRQEMQDDTVLVEDREQQLKEERSRELSELAGRTMDSLPREEPAGRDRRVRGERASELEVVATRTLERIDRNPGEERASLLREERMRELEQLSQRKLEFPVQEGETKEQQLRAERARELAELTQRPTASPQLIAASEELDEVTEELRQIAEMDRDVRSFNPAETGIKSRVRNTAQSWKEREQSASREPEPKSTPTPSRKIGNLFRRDSDYWKLSDSMESLPLPGPELTEPPPPPRQSSRGKIEEYRAPWRKN